MPQPKILIVEDERIVAKDLQVRLSRLGYPAIASTTSGEAALRYVETFLPQLVLMDIRLEGLMDGIEAAERIQERFQTPVVYMTAHADEQTFERAKYTRPCGYLTKPYSDLELRRAIELALHKHRHVSDSELHTA